MAQCLGQTARGGQCKRDVKVGEYCASHLPSEASSGAPEGWRPKEMDAKGCMTQAEFARLLGVTDGTVRNYRQRGIIEMNADGKIEVAKAIEGLSVRGNTGWSNSTRRELRAIGSGGKTRVVEVEDLDDIDDIESDDEDLQTQKLRAQIAGLIHKARIHEIRADELEGLLVRRESVELIAFTVGRTMRDQMLSIADRMSAELSGLSDPAKIHAKLTNEIAQVCNEAADTLENMDFGKPDD